MSATVTPIRPFVASPQQAVVIDWTRNGSGSAFVEAVAGSGKTTTLVEALRETNGNVAFAAYNTKIATEIKAKVAKLNLGNRVRAGTFHSFGFGAWRRAHPDVKAGPEAARAKKDMTLAKYKDPATHVPEGLHAFCLKLVSLAKNRALGLYGAVEDESEWYDIIDHFDMQYDLDFEDHLLDEMVGLGVQTAIRTLKWHRLLAPKIIDFDDMIYMPVVSGVKMYTNDWVFVDEAQDTNPCRRALARKMLAKNGRSVWVGDRHQAIYGFTGADNNAVDVIMREFNCEMLPLTVTFRCPKKVVEMAQTVVSHIEAHETAPDGAVGETDLDLFMGKEPTVGQKHHWSTLTAHDAILCRNTKPLVETAYELIRRGVACHVEGKDIGAGLIKLLNKYKVKNIETLRERLEAYRDREVEKLLAKGKETQAEALADRVATVLVIMDSQPPATTIEELRARIVDMFQDSDEQRKPTLTLSTVHKSKGREWDRVFVLGRNVFMPSRWARQAWQIEQENNLIYVAYTRAKSELTLLNMVA